MNKQPQVVNDGKVDIVPLLESIRKRMVIKINHLATKPDKTSADYIGLKTGLARDINEHINLVVSAISSNEMRCDPSGIVYGTGFEFGSEAAVLSNEILGQMRAEGKLPSIIDEQALALNPKQNKSFHMKVSNGFDVVYNAATRTYHFVVGGTVFVLAWGAKAIHDFVNWVIAKFRQMVQKFNDWRTARATAGSDAATQPQPA